MIKEFFRLMFPPRVQLDAEQHDFNRVRKMADENLKRGREIRATLDGERDWGKREAEENGN